MKVTVNEDGRTNVLCPECGKIFHPHIPNLKNPKVVNCNFCNYKFVVQAQRRKNGLVWVRRTDIEKIMKSRV